MPPEDVEAFKAAVKLVEGDRDKPQNERFFTVQWLTNILNENGYTIGKTSVSEYLRKAET